MTPSNDGIILDNRVKIKIKNGETRLDFPFRAF